MFVIAQITGLIAITIDTLSYWFKEKNKILTFQTISCLFFALQYGLLHAFSGVATNLIAVVRAITCKKVDNKYLVLLFIGIYGISSLIFWDGPFSLLPFIASSIYTISMWQDGTKFIKIGACIECLLWLIYNIYYGAYIAIIPNIIFLVSTIISIYKLNIKSH